jgi:hypothetical protein
MTDVPNYIQAASGVVLVGITFWTLIVLRRYAADTKTIAANSSQQIENSQMPFVTLVVKDTGWAMKNQGFGTAMNIFHTRFVGKDKPPLNQWMTPMAPGEDMRVERDDADYIDKEGFTVSYESLSGKKYRTTIRKISGALNVQFEKIS